jgi:hypothetical protein
VVSKGVVTMVNSGGGIVVMIWARSKTMVPLRACMRASGPRVALAVVPRKVELRPIINITRAAMCISVMSLRRLYRKAAERLAQVPGKGGVGFRVVDKAGHVVVCRHDGIIVGTGPVAVVL